MELRLDDFFVFLQIISSFFLFLDSEKVRELWWIHNLIIWVSQVIFIYESSSEVYKVGHA